MLFTLRELLRWLGVSVFELLVLVVSLAVFSVLLCLKVEEGPLESVTWWWVFSPLFVADAVNAYFSVIVLIRMQVEGNYKSAIVRASWSLVSHLLLYLLKYLYCQRLSGESTRDYSAIFIPAFILLQLYMFKACQMQ